MNFHFILTLKFLVTNCLKKKEGNMVQYDSFIDPATEFGVCEFGVIKCM